MSKKYIFKLKDVANITMGQSPKSEYYNQEGEGTPFLQGNSTFGDKYPKIEKYTTKETRISNKNEVLMSVRAPVGDININPFEKICVGRGLCSIQLHNNQNEYLYYFLKANQRKIQNKGTGTVFSAINKSDVENIEIYIPDEIQIENITKKLKVLDDKIENNNAIIANLEEQAQAIFKSWFVDFEPFQDGEFVESEVGNIPKSFVVKKLEDISTIQNGYAFKSNDYIEKGIKVIRTLNIENNFLNESNYVYLPSEFHTDNSHIKHQLNLYDTLLVMVGSTIGKSGMILSNDLPSLQNQNMWRFRALDKKISPFYINYIVKKINEEVSGWTSGSAREFYRKDVFGKQKIAVPSLVVMERFNKLTQTLFAQIDILKQENNLLTKTRDTLLPKLMSGEIRVEEAIEVE